MLRDFSCSDAIHRLAQNLGIDVAQLGCGPRDPIGSFLDDMSGVAFDPFPGHLMILCSLVQALPPFMIRLASIAATHGLNHVTRVGMQVDTTGFFQTLECERCRCHFSLLVGRRAEILSKATPKSTITKQCYGRGAHFLASVAEARAIAKDSDFFH